MGPTPEFANAISVVDGYGKDGYTYIPVVIIGAGESGIAMGCRLKEELGFDQFRIFERQSGAGGTWWINRYPGVACDIPAIFYSFSFAQNHKWSSFHPPGPEIVNYLHEVCAKYQITDKIQCNTDVEECRWLEKEQLWEFVLLHMVAGAGDLSSKDRAAKMAAEGDNAVYTSREVIRAKIVCSCVGGLVEPRGPPEVPGFESFKGKSFHSARWDYNVDLQDKDVVVIGTGCSAAQFMPRLTKAPFNAKSVTQLMRQPPWVVPRMSPPWGRRKWEKYSPIVFEHVPGLYKAMRLLVFLGSESDWPMFLTGTKADEFRKKTEKELLDHLHRTVPEKYHAMLTPDYSVGCKRRIFDATWFPGLGDPKVELTTQPLARINENSVTVGPGQTYPKSDSTPERDIPCDVLIRANGFDTTTFLSPLKVTGCNGVDMLDEMERRGGPQAYQGTALDGFPNMFLIFGPNTATGHSSVILASENMVNYSLKFIKLILSGEARTVEVKREAEIAYTQDLQRALKKTVWLEGGCHSWYFRPGDSWNSTVYPYTQWHFTWRSMFPYWSHWNIDYTTKGSIMVNFRRLVTASKMLALLVLILGVAKLRKMGISLAMVRFMLQNKIRKDLKSRKAQLDMVIRLLRG